MNPEPNPTPLPLTQEIIRETFGTRIFYVKFRKRTAPHEIREMTCRLGVPPKDPHTNLPPSPSPDTNARIQKRKEEDKHTNTLTVFEMPQNQYRRIPLEGIIDIH